MKIDIKENYTDEDGKWWVKVDRQEFNKALEKWQQREKENQRVKD